MTFVNYNVNLKKSFFDRPKVMKRMDKKTAKVLFWFGGQVRQKTRSYIGKPNIAGSTNKRGNIVKARKPRPPGRPPVARTGAENVTLRNIQFKPFGGKRSDFGRVEIFGIKFGRSAGKSAPDLHEAGGTAKAKAKAVTQRTKTGKPRKRKGQTQKQLVFSESFPLSTFRVPKRPYLKPSFDKVLKKLEDKMGEGKF